MTELLSPAAWIMLTGSLAAASCAVVGCFLVLRRLAMLGDAISHAVLPGIVLAFLATGHRSGPVMLLGAGALGLLTAFITELLQRRGRLQSDAAIGITFTWLFALGVILVSAFTGQIDLDQECVLYGEIAYVPWDTLLVGGADWGPRPVWILAGVFLVVVAVVTAGYARLKLTTFDPALAASMGISVGAWHYGLMGLVSLTTVGAFESVGAILVVAMLVAPAATAYLLTRRLSRMLVLAVLFGVGAAVGGYLLAAARDVSIAGAMAVMAGLFFFLALFLAPDGGIIPRWRRRSRAGLDLPPGMERAESGVA